MSDELLLTLNGFLGRASKMTYAGGGSEVESWRKGFKELEYSEDQWYYRDSYAGFLRSWGNKLPGTTISLSGYAYMEAA